MSPREAPRGAGPPRFLFIDGLRGIASLGVALSHLVWLLPYPFPLLEYGMHGLEVFFVISGFVIAHSLRRSQVSLGFVGNFLLRRSVRLDPVYWIAILGALFVLWLWGEPVPGLGVIGLNFAYLHDLTGVQHVVDVSWTLCLEFQFYIVYVLLLGACQRLANRLAIGAGSARLAVFGPLAILSLLCGIPWGIHPWLEALGNVQGLFLPLWYMFFLGVALQWTFTSRMPRGLLLALLLALGAVAWIWRGPALIPSDEISPMVALVAAVVVYVVGTLGRLPTALGQRWLQYFGRISYSLYVVHVSIGMNLVYLGEMLHGNGALAMFAWTTIALAASILGAHLLHVAVERPTLALSRRLKKRGV